MAVAANHEMVGKMDTVAAAALQAPIEAEGGGGVAVQGPIADILYIDSECCSHMINSSLLAPLQDLLQVPYPFSGLLWLFGRHQTAPAVAAVLRRQQWQRGRQLPLMILRQ